MDEQASQHTYKKLILSVWFVFGYFNGCWNYPLYFTLKGRKDCNFSLFGQCCPHLFVFFSFIPNLLRKAVKVKVTEEGIVGTKHSQEQLDVSDQNSRHRQFYPSFLTFIISVLTDGSSFHVSFEALFCCGWISCPCVISTLVKGKAWFWTVQILCVLFECMLNSLLSMAEFIGVKLQLFFLSKTEHIGWLIGWTSFSSPSMSKKIRLCWTSEPVSVDIWARLTHRGLGGHVDSHSQNNIFSKMHFVITITKMCWEYADSGHFIGCTCIIYWNSIQ